jgi:hypothetical protein
MEKKSHLHGSKDERRTAPASSNWPAILVWSFDMTNIFHKIDVYFLEKDTCISDVYEFLKYLDASFNRKQSWLYHSD